MSRGYPDWLEKFYLKAPEGATLIYKENSADNALNLIYTVPSGKTLYLTSIYLSARNTSGAASTARVSIYSAADVLLYNIIFLYLLNNSQMFAPITYPIPYEVSSGKKVKLFSGALSLSTYSGIHGWIL